MQQGEVIDARMETLTDFHEVKIEDFGTDKLVGTNCMPVCEMERFDGKIITTPNGEKVIDFGQNLAGYVEFTIKGIRLFLHMGKPLTKMVILHRKTFRIENVIRKVEQNRE